MANGSGVSNLAFGVGLATCLTAAGCGAAGGPDGEVGGEVADTVPLYANLGDHALDISTDQPEAQAYFNQGLRLQYAFNHAEAVRSYEAALAADPTCAMCWWGIALALGPNVNAAMEVEPGARAFAAAGRARERLEGTTPLERGLIEALSQRYGRDPESDRTALDSAYALAMMDLVTSFPDHPDVLTLYAASMMNLRPWDYWSGTYGDRRPNPGTEDLLGALERALTLDPNNPGACHYYIHAVEAAFPKRAEACAERLATLMPGAGHIVHMPGHIYIRIGRYADAVRANEHAVHSDETYISDQNPMGVYPAAYYPHNYHFMAFAATMAGMSRQAIQASETVAPKVPKSVALDVYWIQNAVVLPQLTAVSFGRWDDVLAFPMPDPDLDQATVMALYARGVAFAALGRLDEAGEAASMLQDRVAVADPEGSNPVLTIAGHTLAAEMALRSGRPRD
ncbi:MAG: tetratricopeptide repeat protein, partial [Gemmatimonadetes bacterium]|nr:tetratricopeptide repeat protein [Gemmatimonadota bacterium]